MGVGLNLNFEFEFESAHKLLMNLNLNSTFAKSMNLNLNFDFLKLMNLNLVFLKSMNLNLNLIFSKSMNLNLNLKIKEKMNGSNPGPKPWEAYYNDAIFWKKRNFLFRKLNSRVLESWNRGQLYSERITIKWFWTVFDNSTLLMLAVVNRKQLCLPKAFEINSVNFNASLNREPSSVEC